jgi:GDP-4-dehydro-6-deoxy-D-mannose reductase
VDACLAAGWEVHGTRVHADQAANTAPGATYHPLDLRDAGPIDQLLGTLKPDRIYHLAAQASVAAAWADPAATLTENLVIAQRILEAARRQAPESRILMVSSSEVYGAVAREQMPVTENQPLRPVDPYGVSKAAMELLAQQYHLAFGMHVVVARPFNHIGPRQRRGFVVPDFAAGIVAIERGEATPVLRVGNLQTARDFTDVRDVVRAYRLALEDGAPGSVYNISSGIAVEIAAILDALLAAARVRVTVEVDPHRHRPIDRPAMIGSFAALQKATGWRPEVPLARSVEDTLAYWRATPENAYQR